MFGIENLQFGKKTARLSNRMNSVLLTIEECKKEKRLYPILMLIYSSIDILSSLQSQNGFASSQCFMDWTKNYLLKAATFPCNEKDLWGARCGILHTLRYDSRDMIQKSLKEIVYGFYGYDLDIKNITDPTKQAGIYIEDLCDAFITAYTIYVEYLESSTDPTVNANLDKLPKYGDLIPF